VSDRALAIDLGGTAVKLGLVHRSGRIEARATLPTPPAGGFGQLVDGIVTLLRGFGPAGTPLGLATPGYLDPVSGIALDGLGNVPVLDGHSLPDALRQHGFPAIRAINDGIAAALGEARFGAGRFVSRLAVITMGTGIGGAVVIDGRAMAGPGGEPPEFGAIVIDADGMSLEQGTAAAAFGAEYAARGGDGSLTPAEVARRAACGDRRALAAIDTIGRRLAFACGTMINTLVLDCCFLGGGISAAGDVLLEPVRRHLPDFVWPFLLSRSTVRLAETGNDAGLLGAASLWFDEAASSRVSA
jgi:glucokinase